MGIPVTGMHDREQAATEQVSGLSDLERRLINEYQKGLPLSATPFADMGAKLGVGEAEVLRTLEQLHDAGIVSRVGPVFAPKSIGASTLAALAVPEAELEAVAKMVSRRPEVNHNYAREHRYNLWFVVTAPDQQHLDAVLAEVASETGYEVLNLPLERQFHIDLGFPLWC